jgi:CheY-like chemotaxis protein
MFFLPASPAKVDEVKVSEKKKKIFNGKESILLVDDEKGVIDVCSEMMTGLGYTVTSVSSGVEALEVLESKKIRIDLVVLDMVMPKMNGRETFERIRKIDPDMKVLVSSGYSREEEIETMMEKGCNEYILKPFDVAALSEKLNAVFKEKA